MVRQRRTNSGSFAMFAAIHCLGQGQVAPELLQMRGHDCPSEGLRPLWRVDPDLERDPDSRQHATQHNDLERRHCLWPYSADGIILAQPWVGICNHGHTARRVLLRLRLLKKGAVVFAMCAGKRRGKGMFSGASGRLTTVDCAHCRWLPCRDRAYRTVVPSGATKTTGASTDKISHHTSSAPIVRCTELLSKSLSEGALSGPLSTSFAVAQSAALIVGS